MEYKCLECKKNYASYKSLWNHNSKFHKVDSNQNSNHPTDYSNQDNNQKSSLKVDCLICKKCNKHFTFKQNRWRHERTCDMIEDKILNNNINEVLKENLEMKKEFEKYKIESKKEM